MHAERDLLVKRVFPELKVYFANYNINLVDIDLRWGISREEAMKNNNVVGKCLENIDKARPFFIGLLGQRYGWQPGHEFLDNTIKQFPELEKFYNQAYSVTEHEINHALYAQYHQKSRLEQFGPIKNALFYKRQDEYLSFFDDTSPKALKRIYSDIFEENERYREQLVSKQLELEKKIEASHTIKKYSCSWDVNQDTPELALPLLCPGYEEADIAEWRNIWNKSAGFVPKGSHIIPKTYEYELAIEYNKNLCRKRLSNFQCEGKELAEEIKEDLKKVIEKEVKPHLRLYKTQADKLKAQQEKNLFDLLQNSVFDPIDTRGLTNYVESEVDSFCMLAAKPGAGKTTFLASWIKTHQNTAPDIPIIYRFAGTDDSSIDVVTLLRSILKEVDGKREDDIRLLTDDEILLDWVSWIKAFAGKKIIVVIDSIDRLERKTSLSWVPEKLPSGLKLILSIKIDNDSDYQLVQTLKTSNEVIELPMLNNNNKRKIIEQYLAKHLKMLDEQQITDILNLPGVKEAGAPLYLQVLLSELRVFGSFFQLQQHIKQNWGKTPVSAFKSKLIRMASDRFYSPLPLNKAIPAVLLLLANARRGLSGAELTDGIRHHTIQIGYSNLSGQQCADAVLLVLNQLRPFINHRSGRYFFFFQSLQQAVEELWLNNDTQKYWQQILCKVFDTAEEERRLSELPYHLTVSDNEKLFVNKVCTHQFIADKLKTGLFNELFVDFRNANLVFPNTKSIKAFFDFLKKHFALLSAYPEAFAQTALNEMPENEVYKSIQQKMIPFSYHWLNKAEYFSPVAYAFPQLKGQKGIAFNAKGLLAITTSNNKLMVLDYLSGQVIQNKLIYSFSFKLPQFGDQKLFLYSPDNKSVKCFGVSPFRQLHEITLSYHPNYYTLAHENKYLAACYGTQAEVFGEDGNTCLVIRHNSTINQIAFSPQNECVATASSDKTLRVTSLITSKMLWFSKKHFDEVHSVCFTADGRYLLSGSMDEIMVWDIHTKQITKRIPCSIGMISALCVLKQSNQHEFIAASASGILAKASVNEGVIGLLNLNFGRITQLTATENGQFIAINDSSGAVLLDSAFVSKQKEKEDWQEWCCAVKSNKNKDDISAVFGNSNGELSIYESRGSDGYNHQSVDVFNDQVMGIGFSDKENRLKAISGDGFFLDAEKSAEDGLLLNERVSAEMWVQRQFYQIGEGTLLSMLHVPSNSNDYTYISDFKGNIFSAVEYEYGKRMVLQLHQLINEKPIGLFGTGNSEIILANTGEKLYQINLKTGEQEGCLIHSNTLNRFVCVGKHAFTLTANGDLGRVKVNDINAGIAQVHKVQFQFINDSIVDFCIYPDENHLIFITRKGFLVFYSLKTHTPVNVSKLNNGLKAISLDPNLRGIAVAGSSGFKGVLATNN